jgi:hypothetical protein
MRRDSVTAALAFVAARRRAAAVARTWFLEIFTFGAGAEKLLSAYNKERPGGTA